MTSSRARGGFAGLLLVSLFLLGGCAGEEPSTSGDARSDGTAADLMSSVRDPGLGLQPGVPVAEAPVGGQSSVSPPPEGLRRPDRPVDPDDLGYNDGVDTAPIRVLEFSDFGCGYCRQFHMESYPALLEEYMATGKVEWKYVPMVSGMFSNSMAATRVAECAGAQGRFPAMRDLLFERQGDWKPAGDPMPVLREMAAGLELDMEALDRCVDSGERDNRIRTGSALFREVGGRGTPTFIVVGYAPIPGAIPLELFRQVLDTVYEEETARAGEGG